MSKSSERRIEIQAPQQKKNEARKIEMEEKVRLARQTIVNTKAAIFDMIEAKSKLQNEAALFTEKASEFSQKIIKEQTVLEGQRKALTEYERQQSELSNGNNGD